MLPLQLGEEERLHEIVLYLDGFFWGMIRHSRIILVWHR